MNIHTKLKTQTKKKKSGFTLIEVIAVLVLLGILAAIALPKYIDMAATARDRAIDAGVAEMNGREALTWGNAVIAGTYVDDPTHLALVDTDLGGSYVVVKTDPIAPTMAFDGNPAVTLTRVISTSTSPGAWSR